MTYQEYERINDPCSPFFGAGGDPPDDSDERYTYEERWELYRKEKEKEKQEQEKQPDDEDYSLMF